MFSKRDFPVLIIHDELDQTTGCGRALQELIQHLDTRDMEAIKSTTADDGVAILKAHNNISCILVDWELGKSKKSSLSSEKIIDIIRERNDKVPIFVLTERHMVQDMNFEVLSQVQEYVWMMEDTLEFIAGNVSRMAMSYLENITPPFFKELVKYTREYKYSWHTPGHMGGLAFMKSPTGMIFYDFFGENVFRADLSVSVPELGSLMEHAGVNGEAENEAAKNFGAERIYFVTNGTSTANKIVMHGNVTPGDVVLIDRNCHKSLQHAVTMSRAIPIYLIPSRNAFGIIGGIHENEFEESTLKKKIADSPLIKDKNVPITQATITHSTYDGLLYNVVTIKEKLKNMVENLHFDEAWYAYAAFHPIYNNRYAMCDNHDGDNHPAIFSTQSTHKLLAAFSQASMVHVKSGRRKVDHNRFNEAFMMHTSTSPQYNIIASLDVASKMMEGAQGKALIQDAIDEAVVFRKKMVQIDSEIRKKGDKNSWFFHVWQPKIEKISNRELEQNPDHWVLHPGDKWHGFKGMEKNSSSYCNGTSPSGKQ